MKALKSFERMVIAISVLLTVLIAAGSLDKFTAELHRTNQLAAIGANRAYAVADIGAAIPASALIMPKGWGKK